MKKREHALEIFKAAVAAVQPRQLLPQYLLIKNDILEIDGLAYPLQKNKLFVVGAGKASAAMASAVENILGKRISEGFIASKYAHCLPLEHIQCFESAHPVPDENSVKAVSQTLAILQKAGPGDLVLCLLSGGASSLWADIPAELSLKDLQNTSKLLLKIGADIGELNSIRKHLSTIKGGQLLRQAPASTWVTLIISDVPGDDPSVIASGPTVPDPVKFEDLLTIIDKYDMREKLPVPVWEYIQKGVRGLIPETLKPGDPVLQRARTLLIGNNALALAAAGKEAEKLGYHFVIVNDKMYGDCSRAASDLVNYIEKYNGPLPACLVTGGETTVKLKGQGKGGRNQQLALQCLVDWPIKPDRDICLLAAGTDGTDGPTDAAGAIVDKLAIQQANLLQLNPARYLEENDSYHFFEKTGSLLITGPTQTNVMDLTITLVE
ncbi:MAG TPA: DUF4147 domain-containing protein [Chitinophagaceae bacterium]|nr:DUF4147 domain-containing protein [Chitinophagaceae bacterium]